MNAMRAKPHPFKDKANIIDFKKVDTARLLEGLKNPHAGKMGEFDPYVRKIKGSIVEGMTRWLQYGMYDEDGAYAPPSSSERRITEMAALMQENFGFLTPDKLPDFFRTVAQLRDSTEAEPDTSWTDFMTSNVMTETIETREEWDAVASWVMMKKAGQVIFNPIFDTDTVSVTNDEYGAGMEIGWTWLETNKWKIKMQRLAPKVKYQSQEDKSDNVYGLFLAAATRNLATYGLTATNNVIRDYNQAVLAFRKYQNKFLKKPWAKSAIRIVAPFEAWWMLDKAMRATQQSVVVTENFMTAPRITYTDKVNLLGNLPNRIYVMIDKWERNEFNTRIPLTAHGPEDDIERFSTKMTWREAYGATVDSNSIIALDFDPTDLSTFSIYGPLAVLDQTNVA